MDYETLDTIADAYTPLLAVSALLAIIFIPSAKRFTDMVLRFLFLLLLLIMAYGLMFLDQWLDLWPALGWDYSTHTAVAFVLVIFLSIMLPKLMAVFNASLVVYFALMLYQQYHTVADIISTVIVVLVLIAVVLFALIYLSRKTQGQRCLEQCQRALPYFT